MLNLNIHGNIGAIILPVYILAWSIFNTNGFSILEKYSLFTGLWAIMVLFCLSGGLGNISQKYDYFYKLDYKRGKRVLYVSNKLAFHCLGS